MISPARKLAFDILRDVSRGHYAADLLHQRSQSLDSRDAGLATDIVLGVLRLRPQLDHRIRLSARRDTARMDAPVLDALRMAVYQICYLDRIPAHAAVTESVELVKQSRHRSAAGFVNAILRRTRREAVHWPNEATEFCQPEWLLASWRNQFGADAARGIARAFLTPPLTYFRNPPPDRDDIQFEPVPDVPGAYRLLAGPSSGLRLQDVGSQSIVPLLDLCPEHRFLDLCAAPGNKTAQALETKPALAVACDRYFQRIQQITAEAVRVQLDGTEALPFRGRPFDRILLDAPCSGTGTLAGNPEIRWRLTPAEIVNHQKRQIALLRRALAVLAPGGRLVYSTCSLEREENEAVLDGAAFPPEVRVIETRHRLPGRDAGDGFFAAVLSSVQR